MENLVMRRVGYCALVKKKSSEVYNLTMIMLTTLTMTQIMIANTIIIIIVYYVYSMREKVSSALMFE